MRAEATIEIAQPIEDVFDIAVNHIPEWSKAILKEEFIEESPDVVGARFRWATRSVGKQRGMTLYGTVARYQSPTFYAVSVAGSKFDVDIAMSFEAVADKTSVTLVVVLSSTTFFRVLSFLFRRLFTRLADEAVKVELLHLKEYCERSEG